MQGANNQASVSRRPRRWPVAICLLFASGLPSLALGNEVVRHPNVILILADDLGWTDLGCYGSDLYETPHLDRLARDGMQFTQTYSACTVCSPTRAALLTGKYPARLHVTDWIPGQPPENPKLLVPDWTKHLPPTETTLAEVFKSAGTPPRRSASGTSAARTTYPDKHGFRPQHRGDRQPQPRPATSPRTTIPTPRARVRPASTSPTGWPRRP